MTLVTYAQRSDIKDLIPTAGDSAYLIEPGREGLFVFQSGNYASRVTADAQEGIYLKADTISASSGAWVRRPTLQGGWHADWFGVPNDPASGSGAPGQVQCHTEMTAMMNVAAIDKPARIVFASKVYTLGAAIPTFTWQVVLEGARGAQMTIIVKRYDETDSERGVLSFSDWAAVIRNLNVRAKSGSGGSLVSIILERNLPQDGLMVIEDCILSGPEYVNHSLYCNGMSNTDSSGPGYRGFSIRGGQIFGAAVAAAKFVGVQHLAIDGTFIADTGQPSAPALAISGSSAVPCDNVQIHAFVAGDVDLDWVKRSTIVTPAYGNITVQATCQNVLWLGAIADGVLTNNAPAGQFTFPGRWIEYAPTLTATSGTFTSASVTGRYAMVGKTVHFQVEVAMTTIGTASGNIEVALPAAPADKAVAVGMETVATGQMVRGIIIPSVSSTKMFIAKYDNSSMIGAGRLVVISGTYQAA